MGHFCPPGSRSTDPIESGSNPDPDPQPWWWAENLGAFWKESNQLQSEWICVVFLVVIEQSISTLVFISFIWVFVATIGDPCLRPTRTSLRTTTMEALSTYLSFGWRTPRSGLAESRFRLRNVKDVQVKFALGVNFLPKECLRTILDLVINKPLKDEWNVMIIFSSNTFGLSQLKTWPFHILFAVTRFLYSRERWRTMGPKYL